jgi:hypothetical protein
MPESLRYLFHSTKLMNQYWENIRRIFSDHSAISQQSEKWRPRIHNVHDLVGLHTLHIETIPGNRSGNPHSIGASKRIYPVYILSLYQYTCIIERVSLVFTMSKTQRRIEHFKQTAKKRLSDMMEVSDADDDQSRMSGGQGRRPRVA